MPAVQAFGTPCRGAYTGCSRLAEKRSSVQPRPKRPHVSRCGPATPQPFRLVIAHSAAVRHPGDPVSLGPFTSVRENRWSITFESRNASSLILCTAFRSTGSPATAAIDAPIVIRKSATPPARSLIVNPPLSRPDPGIPGKGRMLCAPEVTVKFARPVVICGARCVILRAFGFFPDDWREVTLRCAVPSCPS